MPMMVIFRVRPSADTAGRATTPVSVRISLRAGIRCIVSSLKADFRPGDLVVVSSAKLVSAR